MLHLNAYKDLMDRCSHCELCQATCPVFLEDLLETHAARARVQLIQASLLEGSLALTERVRDIVNRCLLCTNCTQTCPGGVPIDEIVVSARHQLFGGTRQGRGKRYMTRKFMKRRGFGWVLRKSTALAKSMGLAPKDLATPASRPFGSLYRGRIMARGKIRGRVAYYVGCATNTLYPDTGADTVRVLAHNGIEPIIPEGLVCCGMPALAEGDLETTQEMLRTNIKILARQDVDAIVTDCTSCGMMFKVKASRLFPENDPLRPDIERIAGKLWEVTDYLNHVGLSVDPPPLPEEYTYHVPCHRGWTPTINDAPRSLLALVPGARLTELEEPEKCCGAGGLFFMEFKELSQDIRSHKLQDIRRTGVKTVLTQCPVCRSYIGAQLKEQTVMHPVSLLARAYDFEKIPL